MPFKSESQRRFLWAEHPEIARRWAHEYPGQRKLPKHVRKRRVKEAMPLDVKAAAYPALATAWQFVLKSGFVPASEISAADAASDDLPPVPQVPAAPAPAIAPAVAAPGQLSQPGTAPFTVPGQPQPMKPMPLDGRNTPTSNPIGLLSGLGSDLGALNGNAAFGTRKQAATRARQFFVRLGVLR